jgi:peroxiredoxin
MQAKGEIRSNLRANIELCAQIVVAIAVIVVAGVIVKRHVFPQRPTPLNVQGIAAGEHLNLPDVDWKRTQKTLVFFLNKDCHFCTSSAPFYRQWIEEASSKQNFSLVAVLPNSAEEAQAYIQSIRLPIADIHVGPLAPYKIVGTPTVLLVDESGIVEKVWFGGVLGKEKQMRDELLASIEKSPSTEAR